MSSQIDKTPEDRHDPYAALRFLDFRLLLTGRFAPYILILILWMSDVSRNETVE